MSSRTTCASREASTTREVVRVEHARRLDEAQSVYVALTYDTECAVWLNSAFVNRGIRKTVTVALVAMFSCAALAPAGAQASGPIDVRGTYEAGSCTHGMLAECEAKPEYPQKFVIEGEDFNTGALTGVGETVGGEKVSTFTGSISGCTVKTHGAQPGYESDAVSVLSADGTKLQGTFSDSNGRVNQPFFGTRASGPGCGSLETPAEEAARKSREAAEAKSKEEAEKNSRLRHTATFVSCNYDELTLMDTCTAQVADAGASPTTVPTGPVSFISSGAGVFTLGSSCTLALSGATSPIPFCSVEFQPPSSALPAITARYAGDATHAGSEAMTHYLGAAAQATTVEAARPAKGQLPSEVSVKTEAPAPGTTVEATASDQTGAVPKPPPPGSPLDKALRGIPDYEEASIGFVHEGNLLDKAQELLHQYPYGGDATRKALDNIFGELTNARLSLDPTAETKKLFAMVAQLESSADEIDRALETEAARAKVKAKRAQGTTLALAARTKRWRAPFVRLAVSVKTASHAGPLKLKLRLNRAVLKRLARHRSKLTLSVRVRLRIPQGAGVEGVPRITVQKITLRRRR